MLRQINKLDRYLLAIEKIVLVVVCLGLILSLLWNIFTRSFMGQTNTFILEAAPHLVVWLSLLGSSVALYDHKHIKIEILMRFLPQKLQTIARYLAYAFSLSVLILLFYFSFNFVANEIGMFGNFAYFTIIYPIFFGISFVRILIHVLNFVTNNENNLIAEHLKG